MFITPSKQIIKRRNIDYALLSIIVVLSCIGFLTVISAVSGLSFGQEIIKKYLIAIPLAAAAFIFGWLFNYQIYNEQWKGVYVFILLFLCSLFFAGVVTRGSNSWFKFGFVSIQPSEICRIATILVAAAFLTRSYRSVKEFKTLIFFTLIVAPIFLLIMLQPDFSSLVITAPALMILLYIAGVNIFYFVLLALFIISSCGFLTAWTFIALNPYIIESSGLMYIIWQTGHNLIYILGFCVFVLALCWFVWLILRQFRIYVPSIFLFIVAATLLVGFFSGLVIDRHLKNYQRKRIEAFLEPMSDPKGAGYNVLQARIAMGSGGVLGKGFFSGTQSRLGFIPERHTDFILAVLGEELGLLGTIGVLILYILLLWRTISVAAMSVDRYGYLVCCGIFGIFFTYMAVNFGMLIGFVPVAGIPLPFISYGGSNLVASMWAFGIVESVYRHRLSMV
ncbi:MAG: FtsW/RodA/SpoVE family cell cycle protein [Elusimicrobiota bacterium]|jgi:rod shape determining protein RodA|nr:FtsW/RodA/SpoVE family cell cycle protein [Elusimicrobiota bacterium]